MSVSDLINRKQTKQRKHKLAIVAGVKQIVPCDSASIWRRDSALEAVVAVFLCTALRAVFERSGGCFRSQTQKSNLD